MTKSPNPERLNPCMPPLMEEETIPFSKQNTSFGGTACENLVKAYFLSNNINIAEPHVDDGVDLLIQKPNQGWVRGQVKKVVYELKLDYTHKKNFGGDIYRSRFVFAFQGGSKTTKKQRTPKEIDYFYHVLITPHRQLIWETPVDLIPLREDGSFIHGKNPVIDRDSFIRKRAEINYNELLVYTKYDPIIFKTFPNFFIKKQSTLKNFYED